MSLSLRLRLAVIAIICFISMRAMATTADDEARSVLENADNLTLYSLDMDNRLKTHRDAFYRYPVIGKVNLTGKRAHIASMAFEEAADHGGREALCFKPRHALRIVSGGHIYDYFLCYECGTETVVKDGTMTLTSFGASGSPSSLNTLLTEAGIAPSSSTR